MSETNGGRFKVGDPVRVARAAEGSPVLGFLGRVGRIVNRDPTPAYHDVRHLVRFDGGAEDFFFASELDPPDAIPGPPDDLMPWAVSWPGEEGTR